MFIASAACCWYSRNESKVASCYLKHWLNPFCFSNLSSHIHFKAITHWWTTPLSRCHLSQWFHLSIDQNRLNAGGCVTAPLHKRARAGFYWIPFYRRGAAGQQVNQGWGLSEPQQRRDSAPILSQVLLNLRNLMNIWVDRKFLPSLWFSGDVGAAPRGVGGRHVHAGEGGRNVRLMESVLWAELSCDRWVTAQRTSTPRANKCSGASRSE